MAVPLRGGGGKALAIKKKKMPTAIKLDRGSG